MNILRPVLSEDDGHLRVESLKLTVHEKTMPSNNPPCFPFIFIKAWSAEMMVSGAVLVLKNGKDSTIFMRFARTTTQREWSRPCTLPTPTRVHVQQTLAARLSVCFRLRSCAVHMMNSFQCQFTHPRCDLRFPNPNSRSGSFFTIHAAAWLAPGQITSSSGRSVCCRYLRTACAGL